MMKEVINIPRSTGGLSQIILGDAAAELPKLTEGKRVIMITDTNVRAVYRSFIDRYESIVTGAGEQHKTLETVQRIYGRLLEMGADRSCCLVGFGGGIVTDITGFVASTYMRGIRFGFLATTLLAQVDASVGGKNGVNFEGYKNMIGTFNQPDFVLCDTEFLKTLPEREFRAGLSEIIKCGLIADVPLFELFENHCFSDFQTDRQLLRHVIKAAVMIKARIVEADEKESGERRKLNLGHTLAHAIEKSSRDYLHGEAVAIGLNMAAELSVKRGTLISGEALRIENALKNAGLPVESGIDRTVLFNALKSDKKKERDFIHFIYMNGIGRCEVVPVSFERLEADLNYSGLIIYR